MEAKVNSLYIYIYSIYKGGRWRADNRWFFVSRSGELAAAFLPYPVGRSDDRWWRLATVRVRR